MPSMLQKSLSYSWWWDSHRSPRQPSPWLQSNIEELDKMVKDILQLIEEDADSFAKRAEMYYKKRPEIVNFVEQFYRAYRSLAEKYDNLRNDIRRNVPKELQIQYGLLLAHPPSTPFSPNTTNSRLHSMTHEVSSPNQTNTPSPFSSPNQTITPSNQTYSPSPFTSPKQTNIPSSNQTYTPSLLSSPNQTCTPSPFSPINQENIPANQTYTPSPFSSLDQTNTHSSFSSLDQTNTHSSFSTPTKIKTNSSFSSSNQTNTPSPFSTLKKINTSSSFSSFSSSSTSDSDVEEEATKTCSQEEALALQEENVILRLRVEALERELYASREEQHPCKPMDCSIFEGESQALTASHVINPSPKHGEALRDEKFNPLMHLDESSSLPKKSSETLDISHEFNPLDEIVDKHDLYKVDMMQSKKICTLEDENERQKIMILEREEEKRQAIRQLSYTIDMLKEENCRLEKELMVVSKADDNVKLRAKKMKVSNGNCVAHTNVSNTRDVLHEEPSWKHILAQVMNRNPSIMAL